MSRVAYLILAHTDPKQLDNLVVALNHEADFYIHIDRKANIHDFLYIAKNRPNVSLLERRIEVSWGGFSQVEAQFALLSEAVNSIQKYEYLVFLSGLDYPIKPPRYIINYLSSQDHRQHIRLLSILDNRDPNMLNRIKRYWYRDRLIRPYNANRLLRKSMEICLRPLAKQIPKGLTPCFGSSWFAITHDCAEYVFDYSRRRPEVLSFFRHAFCSDEIVIHSIICSSPYLRETMGIEPIHGTNPDRLANFHIIHPSLKKIYTERDFEEIRNSSKLFVRKVTSEHSSKLIDLINENLLYPDMEGRVAPARTGTRRRI